MCFEANGTPPKNQAEFDQNFNSSTGIGPGMAGVGQAMVNAQQPQSAPYQSVYNKPLEDTKPVAPTSSPYPSAYNTPQQPTTPAPAQSSPFQSAYKAPTSVADTFKQSAPRASNTGSGRVVS